LANISFRQVNLSKVSVFVLDGEFAKICGVEDVLLLVDDLLDF
jgi:hypothetical protein